MHLTQVWAIRGVECSFLAKNLSRGYYIMVTLVCGEHRTDAPRALLYKADEPLADRRGIGFLGKTPARVSPLLCLSLTWLGEAIFGLDGGWRTRTAIRGDLSLIRRVQAPACHPPKTWGERWVSNPHEPDYKSGALPN